MPNHLHGITHIAENDDNGIIENGDDGANGNGGMYRYTPLQYGNTFPQICVSSIVYMLAPSFRMGRTGKQRRNRAFMPFKRESVLENNF